MNRLVIELIRIAADENAGSLQRPRNDVEPGTLRISGVRRRDDVALRIEGEQREERRTDDASCCSG